jgi:hypothetical protein
MENDEIDRLVKSWLRFRAHGLEREDSASHKWSVPVMNAIFPDEVSGIVDSSDAAHYELAWTVTMRMLLAARTRDELRYAAPTLGRVIRMDSTKVLDRISEHAARNLRLSYALAFVYTTDFDLRQQLEKLSCPWAKLEFGDEAEANRLRHIQGLAQDWLRCVRALPAAGEDEFDSAAERLDEVSYGDPYACWDAILQISSACTTKKQLSRLAHQLAFLLSSASGQHFLGVIASEIPKNRKLAHTVRELKTTSLVRGCPQYYQPIISIAQQQPLSASDLV